MKIKKILLSAMMLLGLVMFLAGAYSCTQNNDDDNTSSETTSKATDYSVASHWLSAPLVETDVDVFYLYPTAWHKINTDDPNICDIDNPLMLAGAASAFQRQVTAFDTVGNIFAPYYRQADATYTLSLPEAQRDTVIGGIPALDATAAFDYYIKHYNNGRSFILAGHSQGSDVLLFLLSGYLKDNPDVYARMIAAYVIGYPVTQGFMDANPHLKYAEGSDDVGVIISYNTQSEEVLPGTNPVVSDIVGLVINPITWTRDTTLATKAQGLGSFMPDQSGVFTRVPQYADARVEPVQGVLICTTAIDSTLTLGFGPGIYHSYDYSFYYFNLRENAMQRTLKFMETF